MEAQHECPKCKPYSVKISFTREIKPDWFSRMTSVGESLRRKKKFSGTHALIEFVDVDGREKFYHHIGEGILIDEDKSYLRGRVVVRTFVVKLWCTQEQFVAWARKRAKQCPKYSLGQIFLNQTMRILKLPFVVVKNGDRAGVCCEEAGRVLDIWAMFSTEIDLIDRLGLAQLSDMLDAAPKSEVEKIFEEVA